MSERIRNHMIDLSIVGFKGEYDDRESRFVGIGVSGYQIAKRLSGKCFDILDPVLSKSVLDIIHETGESSKLLNQSLSNLHRNTLVIIAGSISDLNLHLLRNIALSKNPMFLWTILDAPKNAIEFASSIQPQINESITIIPQGADFIDQSIVLAQTLAVSSKVVTPVKSGVQCFCNMLKFLDSGVHRNDDFGSFPTFDESVRNDYRSKSCMVVKG